MHLLKRLIEAVTLGHPVAYWIGVLEAAGIPTGRVQDMAQAMVDPQIVARNMVLTVPARPGGVAFAAAGNPIKMTTLPDPPARGPAPALDGDRAEILRWLDAAGR